MDKMVVSEIGYIRRDGEYFMFMRVPGHGEKEVGPFETEEAVLAALDDFNKMCEAAGGTTVPGGLAN